jgi:DNA-binding PucR family transcriptional regulator
LSNEVATKLLSTIESVARQAESDSLTASSLGEIAGLSYEDKEQILDTLQSLHRVFANAEVSLDEFVKDICEFLTSNESTEFHLPASEVEQASDRLKGFLGIEGLSRGAKARILRYEHERTLHDLRILTDARPVFGNDVAVRPDAAVIFHMLKIAYHGSRGVEQIYFSLDEGDLEELKKALLRAEAKAKSLREALAAGNIRVIDSE